MINQDLFGSTMAPSWHQIDRIHIGPRATLGIPTDGTYPCTCDLDSMLVGRYLLIKYVEDKAYPESYKITIMSSDTWAEGTSEKKWQNCYIADGGTIGSYNPSIDCDGIIYQKQNKENVIYYMPIANLNVVNNDIEFYIQDTEPIGATINALWLDTNKEV